MVGQDYKNSHVMSLGVLESLPPSITGFEMTPKKLKKFVCKNNFYGPPYFLEIDDF